MTIRDARAKAIKLLTSQTPQLDVDVILQFILKCNRSWVLAHDEEQLKNEPLFWDFISKRKTGLPVAYLTHSKEFYGYDFYVTPDVLIPKPDTELLVELACNAIREKKLEPLSMADICTGSGCVAISVLKTYFDDIKNSSFDCYCTDISEPALAVACKNAEKLLPNVTSIHFLQGNLCDPLASYTCNLIVSNPPYLPAKLTDELLQDGRSEPRIALNGDVESSTDGMAVIRRLVPQAYAVLKMQGVFLIETGEYNADATADLLRQVGFIEIETICDLAGQKRVTRGIKGTK